MKLTRPFKNALRALGLACSLATASAATVDELIARHEAAIGAPELSKVKTLELDLEITEGGGTIEAKYVTDRTGRMRVDIFAGGQRVWTEALDGDTAWALEGGATAPKLEGPEGAAALKHGPLIPGKIYTLREAMARGVKISLYGREKLDGVDYHVLQMSFPDGFKSYLYQHPESGLIERQRDERAMHPDADLTKKRLESRFSDFRRVDGVLRSFKEQTFDLANGELQQTILLKAVRTNPAVDPQRFTMPK